ncbi:DEAD/DEAH box helicase [Streptomyces bacillaris]|uniref:DEAD/DEAH box helicase n=1 Tax=Streptomyces bacillaris TaxID=68179 RepID=UPI0038286145
MGRYRLIDYEAAFEPSDPPRLSRMVFFRPTASMGAPEKVIVPEGAVLGEWEMTVLRARRDGVRSARAPYWWMPLDIALPELARSRLDGEGSESCQFWGAASLLALQLLARGRLHADVTAAGFDTWRSAAQLPDEQEYFGVLAEAMPPQARALPFGTTGYPPAVPERNFLLGAFLDAAADSFSRVEGGSGPYAALPPQHVPHLVLGAGGQGRPAGAPVSVQISLRLEIEDVGDTGVRAVVQVQDVDPPQDLVDAGALWRRPAPPGSSDLARKEGTMVALRSAARAWPPLERLLEAPVPDALEVSGDEVDDLFGDAVDDLVAAGCAVHWPRDLVRSLTMRAVLGPKQAGAAPSGRLSPDALLSFRWQAALGEDGDLTEGEMDRLAEAKRPFVRLRDQWVRVDAAVLRKARRRKMDDLKGFDAVAAALTGQVDVGGEVIEVEPAGWLATLRTVLTSPVPDTTPPKALAGTLRPYQRYALAWMQQLTSHGLGCCLADDMGLGKTITLIALHLIRQETGGTRGPTLVICPASLLGSWEKEIGRFAPSTGVHRYHGPGRTLAGLDETGFVLTTYGTARLDTEQLADVGWSLVVLDEAQHVKNSTSSTARALQSIPSRGRVALTGTPVENNLSELWSVLDWATPGLLGPLKTFRTRFAKPIEVHRDPAATAQLASLIRPFVLRRCKSDPGIAPELPPKTETAQYARLTREQAVLYEAVVRETMTKIEAAEGIARRGLVLKLLTAVRQICNHPAQYLKEAGSLRLAGRSGKLDLFDELLSVMLAEQQSVLVFTQYVEMAKLVSARLAQQHIDHRLLHGGTPVASRTALVDGFQNGEFPVFVLSLRAAGTGLTLTRASHVIFLDQWWNPAVMAQAADRAYRIGTRHPVQVHSLISEGTVEERIAELLAAKKDLADAVLSDVSEGLTELDDERLFDLIALRSSG